MDIGAFWDNLRRLEPSALSDQEAATKASRLVDEGRIVLVKFSVCKGDGKGGAAWYCYMRNDKLLFGRKGGEGYGVTLGQAFANALDDFNW